MTPAARQSTCVAIDGRAVLIEGPPGIGKSSLALALIDRGAILVGDDSVVLEVRGERLLACPHPRTRGLLEVRNLGLVPFPSADDSPVALVLILDADAPRYVEQARRSTICGKVIPSIALRPGVEGLAIKAELALRLYGLSQA